MGFTITPTDGLLEALDEDRRIAVQLVASLCLDAFHGGDWPLAMQNWIEAELSNDERAACWAFFDSRQRAYLKGDDRKYFLEDYT